MDAVLSYPYRARIGPSMLAECSPLQGSIMAHSPIRRSPRAGRGGNQHHFRKVRYFAKLECRKSDITVAVHMEFRISAFYEKERLERLWATISHDACISQIASIHQVAIYFNDTSNPLKDFVRRWLSSPSTARLRLCVNLSRCDSYGIDWDSTIDLESVSLPPEISVFEFSNYEKKMMDGMKLNEYYELWSSLETSRGHSISIEKEVNLGSLIFVSTSRGRPELVEVASMEPNRNYDFNTWGCISSTDREKFEGESVSMKFWTPHEYELAWFSRANHIADAESEPPPGFLFLCPPEAFENGTLSFRWPELPAYWSLEPSGNPLSMQEAEELGFPSIELETEIWGQSWDECVYTRLRQFHEAKGFDANDAEVDLHLDCQWQVSHPNSQCEEQIPLHHDEDYYSDPKKHLKPQDEPQFPNSQIINRGQHRNPTVLRQNMTLTII
ncbi:hypothetical protein R3P38DRAFT_2799729 [Favolaschia claudopus]|uniref:F-box associated domain-containing protein n=1 Tax=Favolaschia claudopus TaxID=2862362 RepID=A0AAW0A0D8_9AGAR